MRHINIVCSHITRVITVDEVDSSEQCAWMMDGRTGQWLVECGVRALWHCCRCCCFSVLELAVAASKTDPPDVLDRQKCLDALAEQRRSKWFQVCSLSFTLQSRTSHDAVD